MAYFSFHTRRFPISMRKIADFIVIALLFVVAASFKISHTFPFNAAQAAVQRGNGLEDVIAALRTGNASELSKYVDDNIGITLPDKSDSYSKAQAVMILRDFFASNGVKGFDVKHRGNNAGSQFCVGVLQTRSGDYRTTIFMKTKDGVQLVREIRFQSE